MTKVVCCDAIELNSADPTIRAHQKECKEYTGGLDADTIRSIVGDIRLGTWADTVLETFPKELMTRKSEVLGLDKTVPDKWKPSYVIRWHYPKFYLTIARGFHKYPYPPLKEGSVYAVQEIKVFEDEIRTE